MSLETPDPMGMEAWKHGTSPCTAGARSGISSKRIGLSSLIEANQISTACSLRSGGCRRWTRRTPPSHGTPRQPLLTGPDALEQGEKAS